MPSRLFDGLDVINIIEGFINGSLVGLNIVSVLTNNGFDNFTFSGNGTDTQSLGLAAQVAVQFQYQKTGNFDFTIFPRVPADALINRIIYRHAANYDYTITSGINGSGNSAQSDLKVGFLPISTDVITDTIPISMHHADSMNGTLDDVIFDPPISFDDLQSSYSGVLLIIAAPSGLFPGIGLSGSCFAGALSNYTSTIVYTAGITEFSIEVFWEDPPIQFKVALETESPVAPGDQITFTTSDQVPPDEEPPPSLEDVTEIIVEFKTKDNVDHTITIPKIEFVQQTFNIIIWILPDIGDAPEVKFKLVFAGTQFSGTMLGGQLFTIFFVDGTGIYRLVEDKTNDTVYIQDYDPVVLADTKIPNPFFKTGFLP